MKIEGDPIMEFYVSLRNDEDSPFQGKTTIGWGECPNKKYKTTFRAIDGNGKEVKDISITIQRNDEKQYTVQSSKPIYLYDGEYTASCTVDNMQVQQDFKVNDEASTVTLNAKTDGVDVSFSDEDIAEAMNEAAIFAWNWYWDNQYYDASRSIYENGITFCPITKSGIQSQADLKKLTQQYFTADVADKMMTYREWLEKNDILYTSENEGLGGELANECTIQVNKQSDKLYDITVNETGCCGDVQTYTVQYKKENGNWVFDQILSWPDEIQIISEKEASNTDSSLKNFVTSECWMIEGDISVFRFLEDGKIYAWSEETLSFDARKSHAESGKNGQIVGSYTLNGNILKLFFNGEIPYQYEYDKSTGMFNSVDADKELYIAE